MPLRGLSKQAFFLCPKIAELDRLIRAETSIRDRLIEVHPEVSFARIAAMRNGPRDQVRALARKKTAQGRRERLRSSSEGSTPSPRPT
jgi:predicted RNase H-like nuclease